MTTTSWTTTADVPPGAWAAMGADVRRLLAVSAAGGAVVAGPDGTGEPVIDDNAVGFTVTAPQSLPLTVQFARAAGTGTVTTSAPHTTGLVLATLTRATRHWGALVTVNSDAATIDWAVAEALVDGLFGVEDRAVSATPAQNVTGQLSVVVARAQALTVQRAAAAVPPPPLVDLLTAVIAELTAERDGLVVAANVLNPPPPPAPVEPAPAEPTP